MSQDTAILLVNAWTRTPETVKPLYRSDIFNSLEADFALIEAPLAPTVQSILDLGLNLMILPIKGDWDEAAMGMVRPDFRLCVDHKRFTQR